MHTELLYPSADSKRVQVRVMYDYGKKIELNFTRTEDELLHLELTEEYLQDLIDLMNKS